MVDGNRKPEAGNPSARVAPSRTTVANPDKEVKPNLSHPARDGSLPIDQSHPAAVTGIPIVLFPLRHQETPYNGGQYVQHTISDGKDRPLLRYTSPAYNREIGRQVAEIVQMANRGAEASKR